MTTTYFPISPQVRTTMLGPDCKNSYICATSARQVPDADAREQRIKELAAHYELMMAATPFPMHVSLCFGDTFEPLGKIAVVARRFNMRSRILWERVQSGQLVHGRLVILSTPSMRVCNGRIVVRSDGQRYPNAQCAAHALLKETGKYVARSTLTLHIVNGKPLCGFTFEWRELSGEPFGGFRWRRAGQRCT